MPRLGKLVQRLPDGGKAVSIDLDRNDLGASLLQRGGIGFDPRRARWMNHTGTISSSNRRASVGVRSRRSRITRTGERHSMPGSRQVRLGSSATTVPRPTRMASVRARKRWAWARASISGDPGRRAALAARHETVAADGELQGHALVASR